MAALSLPQCIEQFFEPAARAARRGDARQIRSVLDEVSLAWRTGVKRASRSDKQLAEGMRFAIEGILGIVLAAAPADARHRFFTEPHAATSLLHLLGLKARAFIQEKALTDGLRVDEIAGHAAAQGLTRSQIRKLLHEMAELQLLEVLGRGSRQRFAICDIGVALLDAEKPGWQQMKPRSRLKA